MFDILIVFLKDFFEKVDFEKKSADDKKHVKLPRRQINKPENREGLSRPSLFVMSSLISSFLTHQDAEAQVQFELELRKQLARQAGAHSQHLQEVLKVRERELLKRFEHELHGKLIEERGKFTEEIAAWVARLRGIEKAVEGKVFISFN